MEAITGEYIKERFLLDFITFVPLGMLQYKLEALKVLWLIKSIRVRHLKYYLSDKFLMQFVNYYIQFKQGNSINDEVLRNDMNEDHIFITQKIYLRNFV